MSVDLNVELAALRQLVLDTKDDLGRYRDAHSDNCFATVMGPATSEGRMQKAIAKSAVLGDELLQQLLASCDDKDSASTKIAEAMCAAAAAAADRVIAKAIELAQTNIGPNLIARGKKLEVSIDSIATKTANIISEAEARSNVVTAARAAAHRTYTEQWAAIDKQAAMIVGYDKRLRALSNDISTACEDGTVSQQALGTTLAGMHATQKIIKQQRENAISTLGEKFGDRKIAGKTIRSKLVLPENLGTGKGKQLMEAVKAYTKKESDRFGFVMAELNRVFNDYDTKTQSFYKPTAIPAEMAKITATSREFYTDDARALYDDVYNELPVAIKNQVHGEINYGFGAKKLTVRVTDGDGPMLVFALICMFRPCVGVEEDLETIFYTAYKAFKLSSNPMAVIGGLRGSLVEATELHTEFKWSQSGAKIVEVLCHNDHNMSEALEQFKDLTPPDSSATALLHNLFAAISRQCDKDVHYADDNKRSANSAGVFDRIGLKEDGSAKRQRKDGEARYDSSNQTGGKCEGVGCPETKQNKRLCTTCFHKLLASDDGKISTKDGGEIKKGHLCKSRAGKGGKGKGKGSKGKSKGKGKGWNQWYSNSAKPGDNSISRKALAKAWKRAHAAMTKDNSNDETIPGAGGPKSAKLGAEAEADVDQKSAAMAKFVTSLSDMGVKL